MARQIGLYRIMCKDEAPSLRTVEVRGESTSVLNLNLVQYWTPEGQVSPWHKITLWGKQAESFVDLVGHNQACYLDGDLQYEGYTSEVGGETVNKFSPVFKRINEFRLVNVVKLPRQEEGSQESSIAAKASKAATKEETDDIPF